MTGTFTFKKGVLEPSPTQLGWGGGKKQSLKYGHSETSYQNVHGNQPTIRTIVAKIA